MIARIILTASVVLCCLALPGCWDYKELEQWSLLTGLGYDCDGQNVFTVIAYLDRQRRSSSEKTLHGKPAPPQIVVAQANRAEEAFVKLFLKTPQFKYVSHVYSQVFSESFAKSRSFSEILDRITRVGSVRRRTSLCVTPDRVADVLAQRLPGADSTARGLPDLITQANLVQLVPRIDLNEFVYESTLPGMDSMLPEIHIVQSNGRPVLKAGGAAVFHELKMVGYLTPEDVRAVLWITGKSGHSILTFPGFKSGDTAYFRSAEVHTAVRTAIRGGRTVADIKVQVTGTLAVYHGVHRLGKADVQHLESLADRVFRQKLVRVIKKTQAMKVDPMGFGVLVRAKVGSDIWRRRYAHWNEKGYPSMTVHIHLRTHINSEETTGDTLNAGQMENGPRQP